MKILMLGNGFDLYHKLPTAYINFMHIISRFHNNYMDSIPVTMESFLNDSDFLDSDKIIKASYEAYKEIYKEIEITQEEHQQIVKLKNNYWFKFFNISCPNELTWIDFEKHIYDVVTAFDCFFKKIYFSDEDENIFVLNCEKKTDYILRCFNYFFNYSEEAGQIRFEGKLYEQFQVASNFTKQEPEGSGIFVVDKEKIVDFLYNQLNELSAVLKLYFDIFVRRLIEHESFKSIVNSNDIFMNCKYTVNFNYTNTFESLYSNNTMCIHLHGSLNDNIILGINADKYDEVHQLDTTFLKFKKYYQRVIYKTDYEFIKMKEEIFDLKGRFGNRVNSNLVVFGHSLDKTDEDIIREMFDLSDKITIYCYDFDSLNSALNNLISIYGRRDFDYIRNQKHLDFKLINE